MRYLVLLVLHLVSIVVCMAPMLYFAGSWFFPQTLIGMSNVFLAGAVCVFILPCLLGILFGALIDGLSNVMRAKPFYDKGDWSGTRRRTIFAGLMAAGMLYVHFNSFAA